MYRAGKAYGTYAETILCRLKDPKSGAVMAAMVVTALYWGWAHGAAVIMMSWAGVMRIGDALAARRKDLALPGDSAPGTSFLLIVVQRPKTRGRSAKHHAARSTQSDIIRFMDSMCRDAPRMLHCGHIQLQP